MRMFGKKKEEKIVDMNDIVAKEEFIDKTLQNDRKERIISTKIEERPLLKDMFDTDIRPPVKPMTTAKEEIINAANSNKFVTVTISLKVDDTEFLLNLIDSIANIVEEHGHGIIKTFKIEGDE